MNKAEFLRKLRSALSRLKKDERRRTLEYYSELIDDRIDAGESETDAVAALGSIERISHQILADAAEQGNLRPDAKPLNTTLLILGSPIWVSLMLVAFAVLLSIFVAIWSVVITFIATDFALVVGGLGCILGGSLSGTLNSALFIVGVGCFSAAIGLSLFYPVKLLTDLCVKLVKWSVRMIARLFKKIFGKPEVN